MKNLILIIFLFAFVGLQGQSVIYKGDTIQKQETYIIDTVAGTVSIQSFYKIKNNDFVYVNDARVIPIKYIQEQEAFYEALELTVEEGLAAKKETAKKNKEYFKDLKGKYDAKKTKVIEVTPIIH